MIAAPIIDAHVHVFSPDVFRNRERYLDRDDWFRLLYADPASRMVDGRRVLEEMDEQGVERSVIFGFAYRDQALCRETNDYVIELVKAHPGRFVGLACVSPEVAGAEAELERCLDAGLAGCGELFPDGQVFDLRDSRALDQLASVLTGRGMPLLLHANEPVGHVYPGKGTNTPGACFAFAERHPDLTVILAHMGGGLFFYELMPEVRRALARVFYDTSAVPYLYERQVYALAASIAGADKVMFGSDFPLLSPRRYLDEAADLEAPLWKRIFGENARAVFGLSGATAARQSTGRAPTD